MENIGTKVKNLRKSKNLTLKDVSEYLAVSVGYLSQFERGITSIAVEQLVQLADLLEVPMSVFFDDKVEKEEVVVRHYEQQNVRLVNQMISKSLTQLPESSRHIHPEQVELLPTKIGHEAIEPYSHEGEEFVYVLEGILTLIIDEKSYELYPGDSGHYQASVLHNWMNYTNQMVKLLVIHFY